ncbi:hypothetical protein H310_13769 [Aphanomyces invadans]|uniref:Uncharacterized protein n=1 Tax=Aphanomyces invadans TaxID=157072 RepID=A0A024TC13_9STRA|nr:hypothetical protein H310_13769 [Aphanomyces invadans]ETV91700.1 hypothetical protein H310_13769 [Aphanomyces invadans]|eukprot:XP_008879626.1 hypothetical protein H310_13769 [Aphanomyces invadans]
MRVPFVAVVAVVGAFCSVVLWYSVKMVPDEAILSTDFRDGMNVITDERALLRRTVERPYDAQNPTGFPSTTAPPSTTFTTTTGLPTTTSSAPNITITNATVTTS